MAQFITIRLEAYHRDLIREITTLRGSKRTRPKQLALLALDIGLRQLEREARKELEREARKAAEK